MSAGWMASRDHRDHQEPRGSRGPRGSREKQDPAELRASEAAVGSEGTRGQQDHRGGPGSRGRRAMSVTQESRASRERRDTREMLALGAFLERQDQELLWGKLEAKAPEERRARKVCWARSVSPALQDLQEPEGGLAAQVCEVLQGSTVSRERRETQDLEAGMDPLVLPGWRDLQETMEQRETVASLAPWARWVPVGSRAAPGSRATPGTEEPEERRAHRGSRAGRALWGHRAVLEPRGRAAPGA